MTHHWSSNRTDIDHCYKLYLPVGGKAKVETIHGTCTITPGQLYFIPGYHLKRQSCDREMRVHWIHFTPDSYYLHHRLMKIRSVVSFALQGKQWMKPDLLRVGELFTESHQGDDKMIEALFLRVQAILLHLVSELIGLSVSNPADHTDQVLLRLKKAIDFMDRNYRSIPLLSAVAETVHLAPNVFHRLFRSCTGITPFEYMERRRFDDARRLLSDARLNISQVAEQCGYHNSLYFSRVFRRRFNCPPSSFRKDHRL